MSAADSDITGEPSARDGHRLGKRQRHIGDDEPMEFSQRPFDYKRAHQTHCEGALLCLPLQLQSDHTIQQLVMELARCLHEPKYKLLQKTVDVLGAKRAIEIFTKTAETQMQGGIMSAEGDKKRAPGGVFFALIKSSATEEEKKLIFAGDKKSAAKRTKRARVAKRNEDWKRKKMAAAQKVLECFRKDLVTTSGGECEQRKHPSDRNMERRGKGVWKDEDELVEDYFDLDDPSAHGEDDDGELNEGWRNDPDDDHADDYTFKLNMYKRKVSPEESVAENTTRIEVDLERTKVERFAVGEKNDELSFEDRIAVEQFETTDDCDCGVDLSCNF